MSIASISPVGLYDLSMESGGGLHVLDVREADEFAALHAPLASHHALSALSRGELGPAADWPKDAPIYVLCRSGRRSMAAAKLLEAAGYENPVNVDGGMLAWEEAGLPVRRR